MYRYVVFFIGEMSAKYLGCNVVSATIVGGGPGWYWLWLLDHSPVHGSDDNHLSLHVCHLYEWRSERR